MSKITEQKEYFNNTLSKQEALEAMKLGEKVAHRYFSSNEYLYMVGPTIMTEDGYNFNQGWGERNSEEWQTGWFVVKQLIN